MNKNKKQMTEQEYRELGGGRCPYCHSDNITGDAIEVDGSIAWQPVSCDDCGKDWEENYSLIGYQAT